MKYLAVIQIEKIYIINWNFPLTPELKAPHLSTEFVHDKICNHRLSLWMFVDVCG